jgi:hypothetical protein
MMFVASGAVPPFCFKAGGWDLVQSSIDLGPTMKMRIAEHGFFMCRLAEDEPGWTELKDWKSSGDYVFVRGSPN